MYKQKKANFMFLLTVFLLCLGDVLLFNTIVSIGPNLSVLLEVICLLGVLLPVSTYMLVHKIRPLNLKIEQLKGGKPF